MKTDVYETAGTPGQTNSFRAANVARGLEKVRHHWATRLTKKQRIAAIKHYYQSSENGAEASRLANQFGIPSPQGRNITCLVRKFKETGSVADIQRSGRPSTATILEKENELAEAVNRSPLKSSRRLAMELEISQWSVLNFE